LVAMIHDFDTFELHLQKNIISLETIRQITDQQQITSTISTAAALLRRRRQSIG
jgi:hypothetical protein